jgi:hypothetical protein
MSSEERPPSILTVLREGIAALAQVDAPCLERLLTQAGAARMPEDEQAAAGEACAALDLLLVLTRRNLRLLRGERDTMYGRS